MIVLFGWIVFMVCFGLSWMNFMVVNYCNSVIERG